MLLVTGITGHSGGYFLKELIDHKYEGPIRCIVRETSDTAMLDNSGLDIEKVYGSLEDKEFIRSVTKDIDTIMHIYNIRHSPLIIEAAIENRVKRAVLVHTTGIYSRFKDVSRGYKDVEENISKMISAPDCPTEVTILRPTMIYGDLCDLNMSKFIKMIDRLRVMPIINGGRSLFQPVNARDLGKAYYKVIMASEETAGKAYDLSGDRPLQMIDAFRLISENLGKRTLFVSVPLGVGVFLARLVKLFSFGKIDYVEKVQRMGEDRSYPHTEAKKDFDYHPMSFEEGIRIEVEKYLSNRK